jgi:hypothetical protein
MHDSEGAPLADVPWFNAGMTTIPKFPVPVKGKTELKVRAAALATFLVTLAGSIFLSTTATDYVHALPDWLENIIYPALVAGISLLSGRATRTRPDYLSPSTVEAVESWLRSRMPMRTPRL